MTEEERNKIERLTKKGNNLLRKLKVETDIERIVEYVKRIEEILVELDKITWEEWQREVTDKMKPAVYKALNEIKKEKGVKLDDRD